MTMFHSDSNYPHLDDLINTLDSLLGLGNTNILDDLMRNELRKAIANYTLSVSMDSNYVNEADRFFDEDNSEN